MTRTHYPESHIVSMTLEREGEQVVSVATCQCGKFRSSAPRSMTGYAHQDDEIERHWREVEGSAP